MAHLSLSRDALPVAASSLKQGANFFVKVGAHAASIAKVCALSKQPIAQGLFRFDQVADGDFYLFTRILWTVGGLHGTQGGSIMKPVRLTGATMVEVVLAPQ